MKARQLACIKLLQHFVAACEVQRWINLRARSDNLTMDHSRLATRQCIAVVSPRHLRHLQHTFPSIVYVGAKGLRSSIDLRRFEGSH